MGALLLCSLCLTLAQLFNGTNVVIGKYLSGYMSVYTFVFIRFLLCALCAGFLYYRRWFTLVSAHHPLGALTGTDWGYLLAQVLCAGLLFNLIFYHGLQYTTATSAGIVTCSLPVVIAVLAVLLLHERLSLAKQLAILLAMLGIFIINIDNFFLSVPHSGSVYGDSIVFLAMFPLALYSIFSKKIAGRVTGLGTALVSGTVTSVGISFVLFYEIPSPQQYAGIMTWPWHCYPLLLLSGLLTLTVYPLWAYGLRRVPVSSAAIFSGAVAIATSVLGSMFLGEHFALWDGLGMAVVFIALLISSLK